MMKFLSDEELDKARAEEASRYFLEKSREHGLDVEHYDVYICCKTAARLARERWVPTVDPDLIKARELTFEQYKEATRDYNYTHEWYEERKKSFLSGNEDAWCKAALDGIKWGRASGAGAREDG